MKKVIIGIFLVVLAIVIAFGTWYHEKAQELKRIQKFNREFEEFLDTEISGVYLTTVMNKAIDYNTQNEIAKNANGTYQENDQNSIEIIIKPMLEGNAYPMEAFEKVGMKEFTKSFGEKVFKSSKVEYHQNGRISKIVFEVQN
ncbi:MAG: hypothetical protein IJ867_03285 [Clostridia bacterium]|nr:hypothetical protein [Clostridia bacterium]